MERNEAPSSSSVFDALRKTAPGLPKMSLREVEEAYDSPVIRLAGAGGAAAELPTRIDRYQVRGEIARGGIGAVLKAHDPDLGRDVALKVLLDEHLRNPEILRRFIEEAQIASQMQHPGIVAVHGLGVLQGGVPYFTMKLVKGRTLAALLEDRGDAAQDRLRFLGIFDHVCQALAYAHARSVIHRDLKPSNIMVGAFGEVQVMDWGLAKVLSEDGKVYEDRTKITRLSVIQTVRTGTSGSDSLAGSVLGTPAYMSPEQARGETENIDMRSDVFGLGAILCEILTGKPPYVAGSVEEVCNHARKGYLDDASSRLDACGSGPELLALARKCLAFEPRGRPPDAGKVARELRSYLDALEETARRSAVDAAAARVKARADRRARKLSTVLGAAALLLLLVAGGVYVGLEGRRRAEAEVADRAVQDGLRAAGDLLGRARAKGSADLSIWESALQAARWAREQALGATVSPERRDETERVASQVELEARRARSEADRLEKDRLMVDRLEDLRSVGAAADEEIPDAILAHRRAFLEYGIDAEGSALEPVAEAIRSSAISVELARGLGAWAILERSFHGKNAGGWRRLLRVALAAAADPAGDDLLRALESDDTHALRRLAVALDPTAASASMLSVLASALSEHSGTIAASLLKVAAERSPDNLLAHVGLSRLHPSNSEKRAHGIAALALRPEASAYASMGNLIMLEEPANVVPVLETALRRWPDSILTTGMLGTLASAYMDVDPSRGIRYYERAIATGPRRAFIHNNFGVALHDLGNPLRSLEEYATALRIEKEWVYQGNYGHTLADLRREDEAIAALEEAIRLDPSDSWASTYHASIGAIQIRRKDFDAAIYHLREAARRAPDRAGVHAHLGWVFDLKGMLPEAVEAYRRSLELDPVPRDPLLSNLIAELRNVGPPDRALSIALGSFAAEAGRILASGASHRPDLKEIYFAVLAKRLEGLPPGEALDAARAEVARWGRRDPGALGLLAAAQALAGDRRGAILALEEASDLDQFPETLKQLLERSRAGLRPDLPTFASIDAAVGEETVLVGDADVWRYLPGERDPSPGLEWTLHEFDDSGWKEGQGGFGYSDSDDRTVLDDMQNRYTCVYIRRSVTIADVSEYTRLVLRVRSDDGFIAYLNGQEVARRRAGIPGERLPSAAVAYEDHEAAEMESIEIDIRSSRPGDNLLAVQGLNKMLASSDFTLIVELLGVRSESLERNRERFADFRASASGPEAPARIAYLEACLLAQAGRLEDALVELEKACTGAPGEPLPLLRLTQHLRSLGRKEDASKRLRAGLPSLDHTGSHLLELWLESEREAGRQWAETIAAWPRSTPPHERVILSTSESTPQTWRFMTASPAPGWEKPDFDDSAWKEGQAPFGRNLNRTGRAPTTMWTTPDIWLRRVFEASSPSALNAELQVQLVLRVFHDDDAEVYLNGVEVARLKDYSLERYNTAPIDLSRSLRSGRNVIAVHCHQINGTQLIDAGLNEVISTRR